MTIKSETKLALRAAVYYLVAGCVWIFATDFILGHLVRSVSELSRAQSMKGTFFVIASAAIVFGISRSLILKAQRAEALSKIGQADEGEGAAAEHFRGLAHADQPFHPVHR